MNYFIGRVILPATISMDPHMVKTTRPANWIFLPKNLLMEKIKLKCK